MVGTTYFEEEPVGSSCQYSIQDNRSDCFELQGMADEVGEKGVQAEGFEM